MLVLLAAGSLTAQGTLTTHYAASHYLCSLTGGVYFDLEVRTTVRLDRLDVNLISPAGTRARVEVHVRPETWRGHTSGRFDWMHATSGSVVAAGHQQPSACVLAAPVELPPGRYGVALRFLGAMPAYGNASGPRSFATPEFTLTAGASALDFLASATFYPRIFSGALHYTIGGGPAALGAVTTFGHGCNRRGRSFYEQFAPDALDLAGLRFVLTPNAAGGYDVERELAGAVTLASGAVDLGLARGGAGFVPLPASLAFPGGSTPALLVFADGRTMLTQAGLISSPAATPSPSALFATPPTLALAWQDYDPGPGSGVFAATDPATGAVTVTWWRLPVHGAPGSSCTFALTVHADGRLELNLAAVQNPGGACLVGFAAGPGSRDPGPRDLSADAVFHTAEDDPGLGLAARGRPVLGSPLELAVEVSQPRTAGCAVGFAWPSSFPEFELDGLGAPGCLLLLDPTTMLWRGLGAAHDTTVMLPAEAALLGANLDAQAAAWQPAANPLGLVTSNGLRLTIGSL